MTSFAIIGCGALGGLYGAYLHQAGNEVHFLLHSDYQHVQEHGFRVDSIWGDLHLHDIPIYNTTAEMPAVDVVCVCWKSTENHLLASLIQPLLHDQTIILFLQNGIGVEEETQALFPQQRIAGGLAFLCSNKIGPGHIHHLDYGRILMGAHSPGLDISPIVACFQQAQIPCDLSDHLERARWQKLVWNIPYNGLCAILDVDTSVLMADAPCVDLQRAIMAEVCEAAAARNCELAPDMIDKMIDNTIKMKPYMPSMQLDCQQKRPMEITYMYERPLAMGTAAGVPMPHVSMLTQQLRILDQKNRC